MDNPKNLMVAVLLTFVILIGFQYLLPSTPPPETDPALTAAGAPDLSAESQIPAIGADADAPSLSAPGQQSDIGAGAPALAGGEPDPSQTRQTVLAASQRIQIVTPRLSGSIPLKGGRIDDISLNDYTEELDPESGNIVLLSPAGAANAYYAEFGWSKFPGDTVITPTNDTLWTADRTTLGPGQPVSMSWDNGQGLRFTRTYSVDENYMFTVSQRVLNTTSGAVTLAPYGLLSRMGTPEISGFIILHEGALGAFNDTLVEVDYDDMQEAPQTEESDAGGWIGITDKYWLTALIPDQSTKFTGHFSHRLIRAEDRYRVDFVLEAQTVPPGGAIETTSRLFAGAKEVRVIDGYGAEFGISQFDRAIDWGVMFFLTKPIFSVMRWINDHIGNFGISILMLTVLIKLIFFPLANKSYVSMGKMKKLQPKILAIKETYPDDKVRQQQETMALYKKEKVNPMGGCLPMVVQIPVFFALYKVLFVTIEMRHAPFFGWVHDLSAPDQMLLFNLFGAIPWDPPSILAVGIWPLLMGITMFLQQKLNPQPADPMQAKIFMIMPVMFTFLLATFPVGLVIYWTWNNLLTMAQQWVIMKKTAAEP